MRRFIRKADTNGDGAVSREEFNAIERIGRLPEKRRRGIFDHLDKDGDGLIRIEELRRSDKRRGPPIKDIRELDVDDSGSISFEEFVASPFVKRLPEERRRKFFDHLDRNGDGKLSPADRKRGRGPDAEEIFRRLDDNRDGVVDFEEYRQLPWLRDDDEDEQKERFEAIDRDGDGEIRPDEMKRAFDDKDRKRGRDDHHRDGDRRDGGRRDKDDD